MPDAVSTERQLKSLFQLGLDGDQAAYREFLRAMADLLRSYVGRQLHRLIGSTCDAEDVVQEALMAIHAKRHTYERDVPITAWAHAIARYRMIDFLRANGHPAQKVSLDDIDHLPDTAAPQIDLILSVRASVAALPEKFRRPIELMKLKGLSAREAAAMTSTSETSIKVNVHRGLKALARALE